MWALFLNLIQETEDFHGAQSCKGTGLAKLEYLRPLHRAGNTRSQHLFRPGLPFQILLGSKVAKRTKPSGITFALINRMLGGFKGYFFCQFSQSVTRFMVPESHLSKSLSLPCTVSSAPWFEMLRCFKLSPRSSLESGTNSVLFSRGPQSAALLRILSSREQGAMMTSEMPSSVSLFLGVLDWNVGF